MSQNQQPVFSWFDFETAIIIICDGQFNSVSDFWKARGSTSLVSGQLIPDKDFPFLKCQGDTGEMWSSLTPNAGPPTMNTHTCAEA